MRVHFTPRARRAVGADRPNDKGPRAPSLNGEPCSPPKRGTRVRDRLSRNAKATTTRRKFILGREAAASECPLAIESADGWVLLFATATDRF